MSECLWMGELAVAAVFVSFLCPMFRSWGLFINMVFERKLCTSEPIPKITRFFKGGSRVQGTKQTWLLGNTQGSVIGVRE